MSHFLRSIFFFIKLSYFFYLLAALRVHLVGKILGMMENVVERRGKKISTARVLATTKKKKNPHTTLINLFLQNIELLTHVFIYLF